HYVSISNSDRSPELTYIATVYNGIQTQHFDFQPIPGDYLLFFGRIHHDKGTWESIQIAKKARMKLIISGIIQDQNYFKEKVEPFLNNEDIIFLGPSGPDKRNKLLGEAQALLHPINFPEPFGLSVAEAMLCGTPVVAFNRGAMPELILHKKTGFLVHSVEEAVESIKEIPAINRQECRKWSESQFSQETMVKNYIQVYLDVLK
ncbi:MAG: glycosyltransferase, partial [Bacteroidales bacterium]|nr:glycosyltransferase [Bacteroidales bacterium]